MSNNEPSKSESPGTKEPRILSELQSNIFDRLALKKLRIGDVVDYQGNDRKWRPGEVKGISVSTPYNKIESMFVGDEVVRGRKKIATLHTLSKCRGGKLPFKVGDLKKIGGKIYRIEEIDGQQFRIKRPYSNKWLHYRMMKEEVPVQNENEADFDIRAEGYVTVEDCPICSTTIQQPLQTSCKHIFCAGCIKDALREPGSKCPVCDRCAYLSDLRNPNKQLQSKTEAVGGLAQALLKISGPPQATSEGGGTAGSQSAENNGNQSRQPNDVIDQLEGRCAICFGDLKNLTSTPCGHAFCKECAQDVIRRAKQCPACYALAKAEDFYPNVPRISGGYSTLANALLQASNTAPTSGKKQMTILSTTSSASSKPNSRSSLPREQNRECLICLSSFKNPVETPCKHMFCCECLKTVLARSPGNCPLCRKKLDIKDVRAVKIHHPNENINLKPRTPSATRNSNEVKHSNNSKTRSVSGARSLNELCKSNENRRSERVRHSNVAHVIDVDGQSTDGLANTLLKIKAAASPTSSNYVPPASTIRAPERNCARLYITEDEQRREKVSRHSLAEMYHTSTGMGIISVPFTTANENSYIHPSHPSHLSPTRCLPNSLHPFPTSNASPQYSSSILPTPSTRMCGLSVPSAPNRTGHSIKHFNHHTQTASPRGASRSNPNISEVCGQSSESGIFSRIKTEICAAESRLRAEKYRHDREINSFRELTKNQERIIQYQKDKLRVKEEELERLRKIVKRRRETDGCTGDNDEATKRARVQWVE